MSRFPTLNSVTKILLVFSLHALLDLPSAFGQSGTGNLEQILEVWRQRQRNVRSARFAWTETWVSVKGDAHEISGTLTFDGDRLRYTFQDSRWNRNEDIPNEYTSVFNGDKAKDYHPPSAGLKHPVGTVGRASRHTEGKNKALKPFLWTYRIPGSQVAGFSDKDLDEMKLASGKGIIGDKVCSILERTLPGDAKVSLWVDPSQGFVIARYIYELEGKTLIQYDISYSHDEKHNVWIPSTWQYTALDQEGLPKSSGSAKLTRYEINPVVPREEFEFSFPQGTWVTDSDTGQIYLQRKDDAKRIITDNEMARGATYEQLLNSESGMALGGNVRVRNWLLIVSSGGIAVLLMAFSIWRFLGSRVRRGTT